MLKIHKIDAPIRIVINWRKAPAYKLAKMLTKKLQIYVPLPYAFNVKNSIQLIEDLRDIHFNPNLQFVSFYITNMYSNVRTGDVIHTIDFICDQRCTDGRIKYELINLSKTIIEQNSFQFENSFYSQESGLAIGSPTSSIFS
jgi:hypothetical protein